MISSHSDNESWIGSQPPLVIPSGEIMVILSVYFSAIYHLSFFPKMEKCTERLGCALRSMSRESADFTVAFRS